MSNELLAFARLSLWNTYGAISGASTALALCIGILWGFGLLGKNTASAPSTPTFVRGILKKLPAIPALAILWLVSMLFLWVGCYQPWQISEAKLEAYEYVTPTFKGIYFEIIDKGKKSEYSNIVVNIYGNNTKDATIIMTDICKVEQDKCAPDYTFSVPHQIGWHDAQISCHAKTFAGMAQVVPFIIDKNKIRVFYEAENDNKCESLGDGACSWCYNLPIGAYQFSLQVISENAPPVSKPYIMFWGGDAKNSDVDEGVGFLQRDANRGGDVSQAR